MSFGRAQGSVLTEKIVNLAFSRLHLCLEKSQQSSVLLFIPFSYPALGLGETCRILGIPPVSSENRLKAELDEFMFRAGSGIRLLSVQQQLVFITGSFGHVSRWSHCGKSSVWAQLLCYSSHTHPREGLQVCWAVRGSKNRALSEMQIHRARGGRDFLLESAFCAG